MVYSAANVLIGAAMDRVADAVVGSAVVHSYAAAVVAGATLD